MAGLRKEVVKTEIRHKQKSRLLERLWVLGDSIYPRRKSAIREVSMLFVEDVNGFIQKTFVGELSLHELFEARDEIKRLQMVGKLLTLSTEAFTKTRLQLSECWDTIKTVLNERKQLQNEQKETFRHNRDSLVADLDKLKTSLEGGSLTEVDARRNLRHVVTHMQTLPLAHHDVRLLREKVWEIEGLMEQKKEKESPKTSQSLRRGCYGLRRARRGFRSFSS
jgi:soluble cytochrome b562